MVGGSDRHKKGSWLRCAGMAGKHAQAKGEEAAPQVTVVIPTRNAGLLFAEVMQAVASQDHPSFEILVVDTSSNDGTRDIARRHGARIYTVTQEEFSHGGTRAMAVRLARGSIIAFLSQDATPAGKGWLRSLTAPLSERKVAGVFGGQIPRKDASPMERFFYMKRFPGEGKRRSLSAGKPISLEDIFFSNVNSAMRKETLLAYPFDSAIIMSEDQDFAKRVLLAGYDTVYEPRAAVIHSHYYGLRGAFRRYFDSACSLMEITDDSFRSFTRQGISYTWEELCFVIRESPRSVPYLFLYDLSKAVGTFFGRHALQLPKGLRKAMSLHAYHWDRHP